MLLIAMFALSFLGVALLHYVYQCDRSWTIVYVYAINDSKLPIPIKHRYISHCQGQLDRLYRNARLIEKDGLIYLDRK